MLTNRQLLILQVIVNDFIRSAQPVGSRTLSKKEDITFSSATIRNEMADLEELGFIEKPTHLQAGFLLKKAIAIMSIICFHPESCQKRT